MSWTFTPLVDDAVDDAVDDPCQVPNASVIGCENQSLGEAVDLVGTPFQLHYQSDRVPGRPLTNSTAIAHARGLGGWTLSVHHAYDPSTNALYLGSGQRRDAVALGEIKRASGDFLIASEGGEEVYIFDAQGRHLRTLHALTGVSLYTVTYDSQGRLVGITDADGNLTAIERDADGHPTAILSPYGQHTMPTATSPRSPTPLVRRSSSARLHRGCSLVLPIRITTPPLSPTMMRARAGLCAMRMRPVGFRP